MPKDDGKDQERKPKRDPLSSPWVHPMADEDKLKEGEWEVIFIAPTASKNDSAS